MPNAPANDLAVQVGGKSLQQIRHRAVPSLRSRQYMPPTPTCWTIPTGQSPGPGGVSPGWPRRYQRGAGEIPLLAANEMANKDDADVVAKIGKSAYAESFRQAFVPGSSPTRTQPCKSRRGIEAFQMEDYSFHPYSSSMTCMPQQNWRRPDRRGAARFRRFSNPSKGNCFGCTTTAPV